MQRVLFAVMLLALVISAFVYWEPTDSPAIQERNLRAHIEFLASDALQGRGSGTVYELIAAKYIASQLRQFGIDPAGDTEANGTKTFLQTIALPKRAFAEAPRLHFSANNQTTEWVYGKEFVLMQATAADLSGPLQKLAGHDAVKIGAMVLLNAADHLNGKGLDEALAVIAGQKPAAVLVPVLPEWQKYWANLAARLPQLPSATEHSSNSPNVIFLSDTAVKKLQHVADGTRIQFNGKAGAVEIEHTWNVVGVLPGSDAHLSKETFMLSAHLDHLGVARSASSDSIFNGADDDASGVAAVLELARVLGAGPNPQRTVYFALFGSEERSGHGSQHFIKNATVPLSQMIADLQFEMIGRPDPKIAANTLWLTGFERSNLGPELVKHGARLVADPHPEENFFQRSDNYALAKAGVIAHTVSSYGLHEQYHQPNDDIAHLDFSHMAQALNSMIQPVQWLVNSNFTPAWLAGQKP